MSGCFGRWRGTRRSGRCEGGRGQGWEASLRVEPQSAVDRSRLLLRLAPKTCNTSASRRCCFGHSSPLPAAAAAVQQERSPNGALITLREPPSPGPKIGHRPRGKESEERSLRADGRPGQRHPSSHKGPDWKETKNREQMKGQNRLVCSQSPHDETVVGRFAQSGTVLARENPRLIFRKVRIDSWIKFLRETLSAKRTPMLGLITHFYQGDIETEDFHIKSTRCVGGAGLASPGLPCIICTS
jgi:hypothetical protein